MSTRSYIAKKIGEDSYLTIYCHSDGYVSHNGLLLNLYYDSEEKVDELLKLGDLSYLAEKLNPDPSKPHSFDGERQAGVTLAYGRDRGETGIEAKVYSMSELDEPANMTNYVYIFTKEGGWSYFIPGQAEYGLRNIEAAIIEDFQ